MRQIFKTWWPLALGWLIMTVEIPALSAIVARMAAPEQNLAAWGVAFPLVLILGAPMMMILSASTALSKDWSSYLRVRRYVWMLAILLTIIHALLAFTPLYYFVVESIIAVPAEVVQPARLGLQILLPWSAVVGYRRFIYGILIRFGHTGWVTMGAIVRLLIDAVCLTVLFILHQFVGIEIPGIVLATVCFTCGVAGEALYAAWRIRPVLRNQLKIAPPVAQLLTLKSFLYFYLPLVMTSLLQVVVQPINAAAISRMPNPLQTLAVWPVVYGLLIIWMSAGMAYTEAVVVLLEQPNATKTLHRFTMRLSLMTSALLLLMVATPLAALWFNEVAALPALLATSARQALWLSILLPALTVIQSWHQGALMHERRTRGITEAMLISLISHVTVLIIGVWWQGVSGLYIGVLGLMAGNLARSAWLWYRTRTAMQTLRHRDLQPVVAGH
jgi:hypothetical protein